jgi:hypothetical protein
MKSCVKTCLCSVFVLILWSTGPEARDYSEYRGPGIVLRYEPSLDKEARRLAEDYPEIRASVENKLGWRMEFIPTVVLIGKSGGFDKIVGSDLITGIAIPGENLIVIDFSRMGQTPFDLRDTVAHELCHLLLHDRIGNAELPKWLDEGISQWASGGKADVLNPGSRDLLKRAAVSGNLIPLEQISSSFPSQDQQLLLAYEQSRSLTEFIVREYGEDSIRSILGDMAEGKTVEEAVRKNLQTGSAGLEESWRNHLKSRYSWPAYVADHIYWILFASAALITIIAYLKFRHRLKNYRDEEPEEPAAGDDSS